MRVFQRLEYSTEQLWFDFSKQYSTKGSNIFGGSRQAIQDLKDKYLDDEQAAALEEEERKRKENENPPSLWKRAWKVVMENLELGGEPDPYASADDDDASAGSLEGEEGVRLNKRERKLLYKHNSYSDVI